MEIQVKSMMGNGTADMGGQKQPLDEPLDRVGGLAPWTENHLVTWAASDVFNLASSEFFMRGGGIGGGGRPRAVE